MDLLIKNVDPRPIKWELLEIYKRAYQGGEEYAYRTDREILDYFTWLRRRAPEGFLVAFLEERPIGFVAVDDRWIDYTGERIGEIHEWAVDPSFQGRGIGKRLFLAGLDLLRAKGHQKFGLWVGEKSTKALAFYRKLGFQEEGRWGIWVRMIKDEG